MPPYDRVQPIAAAEIVLGSAGATAACRRSHHTIVVVDERLFGGAATCRRATLPNASAASDSYIMPSNAQCVGRATVAPTTP